MKNKLELNESELISLLPQDEEHIKDLIYQEYGYLIDVILHKYHPFIKAFSVDEEELKCEASLGFSDGIHCFTEDKNASLKTFLSLCVERRITNFLEKYTTQKSFAFKDALSLDYSSGEGYSPLLDTISDENKFNPLHSLASAETVNEIITLAKENLSDFEYSVFIYMLNGSSYQQIAKHLEKTPKQIDNTIQRIKIKMRKVLNSYSIN